MLAVGSIQPLISEKVSKGQLQFDIPGFLTEVVLPALDTSGNLITFCPICMMKPTVRIVRYNNVWLFLQHRHFLSVELFGLAVDLLTRCHLNY